MFRNVAELVELAESKNVKIAEIMILQEMEFSGLSREQIIEKMDRNLTVMEQAVERGLKGVQSVISRPNGRRCRSFAKLYQVGQGTGR